MNLYRFFKSAFSITFIIQVVCAFTLVIYLIFYAILLTMNILTAELETFFTLIALGGSLLIVLVAIGFFMRVRDRFLGFLGAEEDFPSGTVTEKVVLIIWIAAIIIFGAAMYYALYLIYEHFLANLIGSTFSYLMMFLFIGIIIVCFVLQVFVFIMTKYTRRVVKQVLQT